MVDASDDLTLRDNLANQLAIERDRHIGAEACSKPDHREALCTVEAIVWRIHVQGQAKRTGHLDFAILNLIACHTEGDACGQRKEGVRNHI